MVDVESGNITIKKTSDNSTIETIAVGSSKVSGTGTNTITINPAATLAVGIEYYVLIDTTAFDDPSGNSYPGISSTTALSFTTVADSTDPTLSSSSPANGAKGVGVNPNIILNFSEAVVPQSGNIVIVRTYDNAVIETIGATSSLVTGSGTSQITINPSVTLVGVTDYYVLINASAFDDPAGNSYAGIANATLNFITADVTGPAIFSTYPRDGETGVPFKTDIVLTFTEAVDAERGTITIKTSVGNKVVESFDVKGKLVSGSGTDQITIKPTNKLTSLTGYYITVDASAFDDASGNSYAGISDATTLNFATVERITSPRKKKDVMGSLQTSRDIVSGWASFSMDNAFSRISWLDANKGTSRTSHQGIKLHFRNEIIDILMNSAPSAQIYNEIYFANKAYNSIESSNGSLLAISDHIKSDAAGIVFDEASRLRERLIGTLNPTFEPVIAEWSMWTDGKIMIGKSGETTAASKKEFDSQALSLGFDRPLDNNGLVGFVLEIGQNNVDIGGDATNVKSKNYSLSNYTSFTIDANTRLESVVGVGSLKIKTIRTDGAETLTGKRAASQQFFSTKLIRKNELSMGRWKASPYLTQSATRTNLDGYSESGGALALTFDYQEVSDTKVGLGVDVNSEFDNADGMILRPYTQLEYNRARSKSSASMYYTSEGPDEAYEATLNKSSTNWKLKLGADLNTDSGWNSSASFTREQSVRSGSDHQYSNSFSVNTGKRF